MKGKAKLLQMTFLIFLFLIFRQNDTWYLCESSSLIFSEKYKKKSVICYSLFSTLSLREAYQSLFSFYLIELLHAFYGFIWWIYSLEKVFFFLIYKLMQFLIQVNVTRVSSHHL